MRFTKLGEVKCIKRIGDNVWVAQGNQIYVFDSKGEQIDLLTHSTSVTQFFPLSSSKKSNVLTVTSQSVGVWRQKSDKTRCDLVDKFSVEDTLSSIYVSSLVDYLWIGSGQKLLVCNPHSKFSVVKEFEKKVVWMAYEHGTLWTMDSSGDLEVFDPISFETLLKASLPDTNPIHLSYLAKKNAFILFAEKHVLAFHSTPLYFARRVKFEM